MSLVSIETWRARCDRCGAVGPAEYTAGRAVHAALHREGWRADPERPGQHVCPDCQRVVRELLAGGRTCPEGGAA